MDTGSLIRTLVADNDRRARSVAFAFGTALAVAAPISISMFFSVLGFRKDIGTAIYSPFFDLKFVVAISLVIPCVSICVHLARPEASLQYRKAFLLFPAGVLVLCIIGEMLVTQSAPWMTRMIGSNALFCLTAIPILSLPFLAASLTALRHGAHTYPRTAGAYAGTVSGGLAAILYASQCTDDSPLFVAIWYPLAIGSIAIAGSLTGSRWLRI